jgi:hypothetical protein
MKREEALFRWPAAVVVSTALLLSGASHEDATAQTKAPMRPDEVKAIAEEGYVYGLPLVMSYAAMYEMAVNRDSAQFKAPFNEIANEARVFTYQDTAVIVPNSDTPYSMLFMDLRAEPLVLSVPAVDAGRYYSVQLVDANTFNYGYIGTRATGNGPGEYLVVGPGWTGEKPAGVRKVFRSSTAARTFAVDVLACPKCHGRMRLLALVQDPANVARFLAAMGEPTEVPRRSPPRGPPYWKSRVLRRQVLGDEDGAQGRWVPQTA